jgi:hypothetical protein
LRRLKKIKIKGLQLIDRSDTAHPPDRKALRANADQKILLLECWAGRLL